ncbi:hypothetical protein [Nocardiopsis kunsanensis]|nr:hypothetical protein [Nocardiopsis kunsanensis]
MAPVSHSRSRRSGRWLLAATSAVAMLGLAGCSIDLSHLAPGGDEEDEPTAEESEPVPAEPLLESALADLAGYPALTADGQIAESVGADVQDVSLTVADGGAASGTLRLNEAEAEVAQADEKLYVKAAESFWLDKGVFGPDFDDFEDNWVRSNVTQVGVNPASSLTPPALSQIIEGIGLESDEAEEENLDGDLTHKIDLAGERNQLWVDAETEQIKRIEIEELTPEGADTGPQVRLDLAEADEAAVNELYDGLVTTAEDELTGSRDARVEVGWSGAPEMDCEAGPLCTWTGTVHDAGGDGVGNVAVRMDVTFTNDEIGEQECDDSGTLEAGSGLELSCEVNYNIVSETEQSYEINGEAQLVTRGLTGGQQEEMLAALDEQREATLNGGAEETEGAGDEDADQED